MKAYLTLAALALFGTSAVIAEKTAEETAEAVSTVENPAAVAETVKKHSHVKKPYIVKDVKNLHLTADQRAATKEYAKEYRQDVKEAHRENRSDLRSDFNTILTDDQKQELQTLREDSKKGEAFKQLDLSAEQRQDVRGAVKDYRTDMKSDRKEARSDLRQSVKSELKPRQQKRLAKTKNNRQERRQSIRSNRSVKRTVNRSRGSRSGRGGRR